MKNNKFILCIILFLAYGRIYAQQDKISVNYNITDKKIAISGYDAVSYFDGKPLKGNSQFTAVYEGVTYLFSSTSNLNKFKSHPAQYIPAYGGWCAYAMAYSGEKVKVDPETFKIIDGKNYLFYNFYLNNTLNDWNKDEKNYRLKADKNWNRISHESK